MGDKNLDNLSDPSKNSPRTRRKRKAPPQGPPKDVEIEQIEQDMPAGSSAMSLNTTTDPIPIVLSDVDEDMDITVEDQPGPSKAKRETDFNDKF